MPSPLSLALARVAEGLRQAKPQDQNVEDCWRRGDLSYKMWAVQKKMAAILESPSSSLKRVLKCSRRLRKTTTALIKSIEIGRKKKNGLVRFASSTRDSLIETVEPIIELICEDAPDELKPIWKRSQHHYFFPGTNARLYVAGCDNLKMIGRLRGRAADLCVVDEAQEIVHLKYLVEDVLMPQLLGVDKPRGHLWLLFTPPKTPIHDCFKYAEEARGNGTYGEFDIYKGEYSPEVIEIFKKEAGGENSTTWKREYLVQEIVDENFSIIPEFKNDFVREYIPDEFYKFYFRYAGMDIGVRDKTVVLFAVYDFKQAKLFIQEEFVINGPQMTTEKVAEGIKEKEKKLWNEQKPSLRIADNNNLILLQDLGLLHGLHFAPTSKDTLEAMVNNLRLWIANGRVVVSPRCSQLIGCLKYGVWNDKRKDFERSSAYGHFDALAALIYLVRNIDVNTNPIPKDHGLDFRQQFIIPDSKLSGDAETFRKVFDLKKKIKRAM